MKKLFLILFLACNFIMHASPEFKVTKFRWRNDNGTETSATWKAATGEPIKLTSRTENIRLRFNYYNQATTQGAIATVVSYSKNGGEKVQITDNTLNDFVLSTSSFVTHATPTTNQLPTAYTYLNGVFVSQTSTPSTNLTTNQSSELEFCIRATAVAANETTYIFYIGGLDTNYANEVQPASLTTQFCVAPPTPTTNFSSGSINYIVTSPTTVAVGDNTSATGVVVIPDAVTVDCQTLAVTSIASNAFSGCSGLTSVTIPSTVTSMGNNAFLNCTGLTSVICNVSNPIPIDATVFAGVNQANCSLNVPNASIAGYQAEAVWQNFTPINSIVFNITSISACTSYSWANNNVTYTTTGVYTGTTSNNVTQKLDLTITLQPTNFSSGGINYVVTSPTTVMVGSNTGATGAVVIPSSVTTACGTYAVTGINDSAFSGRAGITSITIPDSVTRIGQSAFQNCSGLTSVFIPNSVTSIGPSAFYSCTGLTSVIIPNSLTSIANTAFQFCTGLTSVTIPSSVTSIATGAFSGCSGLTSVICNVSTPITIVADVFGNVNIASCRLAVPATSVAAYQAAAVWRDFNPVNSIVYNTTTVTACASYTWANNNETYTATGVYTGTTTNGITEQLDLTITNTTPPSATAQTFCGSKTVADLVATGTDLKWYDVATNGTALASTTAIATGTYYVTQTLNSCESDRTSVAVTVNTASPPSASAQTFCSSKTVADLVATGTDLKWYTVATNGTALASTTAITTRTYYVSQTLNSCESDRISVSVIVNTSFTNDGINYVVTSPTTVAVGVNASATGVVVIPNSVTTACGTYAVTAINGSAFQSRAGVTSVTIPNTVTTIGSGAFAFSGLTSIILPNSVTSIAGYAFYGCSGLTTVTLPNAITSLSDGVFSGCSQLSSITIPNSVTTIGDNAFQNCSSLTSITIPNTVTSLGQAIFQNCSGLTSVSISNAVTSIGNQFFQFCTSLTSVTIPNSVTSIGQNVFQGCSSLSSVTLSNSLTNIGSGAFNSCGVLSTITIPNSVISIGSFAFVSCSGLTTVTIGNSLTSIGTSAFASCTGLTSVICNVSTPINIDSSVFANVNQAACSLTVPAGSVTAYQAANVWKVFNPIVSINAAPTAAAQTLCGSKTVADLVATGTDLKWYDVATNGTALELTTAIASGTYYVSQTLSGSESARTSVEVTVNNSVAGTVSEGQLIVRGTQPAAISLTDSSGSVQWQISLNNSTFKNIVGATGTTLTSNQMGILTSRKFYRAVVKSGDCSSVTSEVVQVWTTLTTKIQDSQCGKTLASLTTIVSANSVPGADLYRFKVVQGATTRTIVTRSRGFILNALGDGALLNTTYKISVATQSIGLWSDYGTECTVTTPSGITKIQNSQCGQTLASLTTNVTADAVAGVTNYRFKVVQGETTRFLETTARFFNLKSLDGGVFYNTAYTISVATKYNGNWSNYGTECTVTTPSGLTKIKDSQCGTTLASLNTNVVANAVAGVSHYSFKVVQGGTTRTIEKVAAAFSLKSLVGGALSGTAYTISVATKYNGVWGNYGAECMVSTPAIITPSVSRQAAITSVFVSENVSEAVSILAYPNPFTTTFKLDFQSSSDANILVSVYDMNGRLIENQEVKSSEINNLELGNGYPSGVYNVIITQETEVKTIRVIKK